MDKETLYEDSEFAAWLKTMPENVKSNYAGYKADLGGTRIEEIGRAHV